MFKKFYTSVVLFQFDCYKLQVVCLKLKDVARRLRSLTKTITKMVDPSPQLDERTEAARDMKAGNETAKNEIHTFCSGVMNSFLNNFLENL